MPRKLLEFPRVLGKTLDRIRDRDLEPIWDPYLYAGELSYLEGLPGTGKTTILCDLAARLSIGGEQPLTGKKFKRRRVVMLVTEDAVDATIKPRIEAAGPHDPGAIMLVEDCTEFGDPELRRALTGGDTVLLIETLSNHIPRGVNANNEPAVREALAPLLKLLRETGTGCLAVRHWNKRHARHMFRGLGSIGFNAVARTVTACVQVNDTAEHHLVPIKNNYSEMPPNLVYRTERRKRVVGINWVEVGEKSDEIPGLSPGVSRAVRFIQALFAEQQAIPAKQARAAIQEAGISQHSTEEAMAYLGYSVLKMSEFQGAWIWVAARGSKARHLRDEFQDRIRNLSN